MKGRFLRPAFLIAMVLLVTGCGSPGAQAPTATTVAVTAAPVTGSTSAGGPTPTVVVPATYAAFVRGLCSDLSRGDAARVAQLLPYYKYNSGVRYGVLGDGAGQSGDPSLMNSWLSRAHVHCRFYSSGGHGHGTVLAAGWKQPGGWSLIELDIFSGKWKINDFTFGNRRSLFSAMQTDRPILPFRNV